MNRHWLSKLATLLVVLLAASSIYAQQPARAVNLRVADAGNGNKPEVRFLFDIEGTVGNGNKTYVALYLAQGEYQQPTADFVLSGLDKLERKGSSYVVETFIPIGGTWSAYVSLTTQRDTVGANPSNVVVFEKAAPVYINFLNGDAAPTARVGQEYTATFSAEASDGSAVEYSLAYGPSGMTIDKTTGVLTWTPSKPGTIRFGVQAKSGDAHGLYESLVSVRQCDQLTTIGGTVTSSSGAALTGGYVAAYPVDAIRKQGRIDTFAHWEDYQIGIVNPDGTYSLEVDKGEYYVQFFADNHIGEFFDNAQEPKDAQTVSVDCGQTVVANAELESIFTCAALATINGTVTSSSNRQINGYVIAYPKEMFDVPYDGEKQPINRHPAPAVVDEQGNYTLSVDKGEYYLQFVADGHKEEFYNDAWAVTDATVISVDCAQTITADVELEAYPIPVFRTVTGRVTDEETGEGLFAMVQFQVVLGGDDSLGFDPHDPFGFRFNTAVYTDMEGNFTAELPEGFDFKAQAFTFAHDADGAYFPEYWQETADYTEAATIRLTEDLANVNFTLTKIPVYNNSISGSVATEQGEFIDSYVIAYRIPQQGDIVGSQAVYTAHTIGGAFTVENMIPGSYLLLALPIAGDVAPGFYVENGTATLEWENATTVEVTEESNNGSYAIVLAPMDGIRAKGRIRGVVRKGARGLVRMEKGDVPTTLGAETLGGAMITFIDEAGKASEMVMAHDDGSFELPAGKGTVVVSKFGFVTLKESVDIQDGAVVEHSVELTPATVTNVEEEIAAAVAVFPNPTASEVRVSVPGSVSTGLQLYSVNGTLVGSATAQGSTAQLDVSTLPVGAYVVRVESNGSVVAVRTITVMR